MTRNPRAARAVRGRLPAPIGASALALMVLAMSREPCRRRLGGRSQR